jgi:hypothetical protein
VPSTRATSSSSVACTQTPFSERKVKQTASPTRLLPVDDRVILGQVKKVRCGLREA